MRTIFRSAAWVLGVAAVSGTVIGMFGDLWWGFDLLANFRLQYALTLGLAAVVAFRADQRIASYTFVVFALFNVALIAPLYTNAPAPIEGNARLEIVSSNLQTQNSRQQINWLVGSDPDLVFLFESSHQAEDLLRSADLGYVVTSGIEPDNAFGLSILSKSPVEFEHLPSSRDGGDAIRLEAQLGEQTVVIFAIHPPSPSNPLRSESRDRLLERIGKAAADEELPVIVVGDFNATPWSAGFRKLAGPGDLVNSQMGYGYSATWPAYLWPILGVPLDHLVHSDELTAVEREVGPSLGPDHRPIRVVIGLAADDAS
jgi:endonuclease/exonuclease/phosphatase (EEP) superfamily protein YafD